MTYCNNIDMTTTKEPAVKPAPIVKPGPSTTPKPKPRRGDPWTVPGPKVNPTPKAQSLRVMKNDKNKKKVIDDWRDFKAIRKVLSHDDFFKKFDLSMKATAGSLCSDVRDKLKTEDKTITRCEMTMYTEPYKPNMEMLNL
jgi:hypothetical protein